MTFKKRYLLFLPLLLGVSYLLGPKPNFPEFDGKVNALDLSIETLDRYLYARESKVPQLKPNNEAHIIWADSIQKTEWAVVYLHGFSASQMEGDPIHRNFAKRYGCNLYLSRLAGHGIDTPESFLKLTPKALIDSAKEALAIGKLIGEKVILMSCSTGGTLSAYLASENPEYVDALIMYSPNIDLYSASTNLLTYPWGLQLARYVQGENYFHSSMAANCHPFWTQTYRLEGTVALQDLIDKTMTAAVFKNIKQPLFAGYYYKNEEEQDKVISVPAIRQFFEAISTPEAQKRQVAFPNAGGHVFISSLQSQDLDPVRKETNAFAEEVLGLVQR